MYLNIENKNDSFKCELPVEENGIKITEADLRKDICLISDKKADWSGFDYLEVTIDSKYASESVLELFVLTDKKENGLWGGYLFFITISWIGKKVVTLPLKYGIVTHNNPIKDLKYVSGVTITAFHGGVAPGKTELYIRKINPTNEIAEQKEWFIECDENKDYFVEGVKNQKLDAISILKERFPDKKHPRLILTEDRILKLRKNIEKSEFLKQTYEFVKNQADEDLKAEPLKYNLYDGRRLSRDMVNSTMRLLIIYIITGEKKYKDKIRENILAQCKYPDWNPSHDIDVGDLSRPVALAYDWLYNEWTDEEKRIMRNAMLKNGFEAMITPIRENLGYAADEGNHNTVTITGLGMLALAIGDEAGCEDISNEIINATVDCLPKNLKTFAPFGVCTEGAGYWAYGQENFYLYQSALCKSLGTDFGLGELPGMDTTGDYLIAMHGAKGKVFNYYDAHDRDENFLSPSLLWLADFYNKKEYANTFIKSGKNSWMSFIFFKEDMLDFEEDVFNVKDGFFGNVGAMKRGNGDEMLYLGFKGGKVEPHCDLDWGTFVFDAFGERWVSELGCDPYDMPGMWEYHKTAGRWKYYRKRAEGNNCIVINPKFDPENIADISVLADCNIEDSKSGEEFSYAKVNLTSAYPDIAESIMRTYRLYDDKFELCDSISLKEEAEVYSFIHTKADVEILNDGKCARMTLNGKTLNVSLETDADFKLLSMPAEPLSEELLNTPHNDNSDYGKIAIYGKNIENAEIKIVFGK